MGVEVRMISLSNLNKVSRLLCIGAHPDDIELGAGGTIMRLAAQNPGLHIHWVVLTGADPERVDEAGKSAALFTTGAASLRTEIHPFRDGFLPWEGNHVKTVFEALKGDFSPDLILTHYREDRHQDHRLLSDLTWNTWRNHWILEYEIFKWDGDLGQPNFFVPLEESLCRRKVEQIYDTYPTQHSRAWFRKDNFLALMRLRGVECNNAYAEAFYARKLVW
jgi:LmbE family N-acetylglucosaminyl deacetylase